MSKAQTGCLVSSNNTTYTVQDDRGIINAVLALVFGGNPVYQANPNEPGTTACIANSQIKWIATSQNCTVCPFGYSTNVLGIITGCSTATYNGKIANRTVVNCPLDDYYWAFGASAAALGIFVIRKRKI